MGEMLISRDGFELLKKIGDIVVQPAGVALKNWRKRDENAVAGKIEKLLDCSFMVRYKKRL